MKFYIVVLCLVTLSQLGSTLIWEDEDAVGIEAAKPKKKKQSNGYDLDVDVDLIESEFDPDYGLGYGHTMNSRGYCRTRNGQTGVCAPLADCYPILYTLDTRFGERNLTNWPLAEELLRASGPCTNNPNDFRKNIVCCATLLESQSQAVRRPARPGNPGLKQPGINPTPPNCGFQNVRVVGEKEEVPRQGMYPWMAAIMINGRQFCGGSLIDDYHVMTAAHCIQHMNSYDVNQLRVYLGAHDLYSASETGRVVRRAARVTYHKSFSHQTLLWDIAVIRLNEQVQYNRLPNVNAICLATGNPRYDVGWPIARLAGWGKLWNKGPQPSRLHHANVNIFPQEECRRRYGRIPRAGYIADHNVCAQGSRGSDACQGDSGGPLMRNINNRWEQIGIVSWGVDCGRYPGVYTRVDHFLQWLEKQRRG